MAWDNIECVECGTRYAGGPGEFPDKFEASLPDRRLDDQDRDELGPEWMIFKP
jgi:hypothetical protein